jgi:hypothetical protein
LKFEEAARRRDDVVEEEEEEEKKKKKKEEERKKKKKKNNYSLLAPAVSSIYMYGRLVGKSSSRLLLKNFIYSLPLSSYRGPHNCLFGRKKLIQHSWGVCLRRIGYHDRLGNR